MSLHIGNLSSSIHKNDLHRLFRRFGRCNVRVKDKYGFVVYDYPASAEKALKTLRGRVICGRAITLSWSNQQPRAMQRFAAGGKSYGPPHRSNSVKESADQRFHSYDRRAKKMDFKEADGEIRTGSSDLVDDSKHHVVESSHTSLADHRRIEGSGRNPVENDRWGEQVADLSNEIYLEKGMDFERYEPYHSEQKDLDEHRNISPLAGSAFIGKTLGRTGNTYHKKSEKGCYLCGDMGHKMSKCPLELKKHVARHREGLHPCANTLPLKFQKSDIEPSIARGRRKGFRDNKRNRRDYESWGKNHLERTRGPSSSSIHSDYTSSRSKSPSRSVKSLSQVQSPSKKKPVPSENDSLPSIGSSPSHNSGSETFKLQSTLMSMSPTSALSPVEVNGNVSPSRNKKQKDYKGSGGNAVGFAHSMNLYEEETVVTSDTGAFRAGNIISSVENESRKKPAELEQVDLKKNPSEKDKEHYHSVSDSLELLEPHVPLSDSDDQVVDNLILQTDKGTRDSQDEERVVAPLSDNYLRDASSSLRMSSKEVCTILKHYGLQPPEVNEKDLPVESYFGSARLWPWEIIYYRRLKKGPISTENYSRRIAQNEEFGIVDKYIRSSSGWGEVDENSP